MKTAALPLLLTSFGELELVNALSLRLFRKELTASQIKAVFVMFRKDIEAGIFIVNAMPARAYGKARQIAQKQTPRLGTRTLDVLHVASALVLQAQTFYTFDMRQAKLAAAEGLLVP